MKYPKFILMILTACLFLLTVILNTSSATAKTNLREETIVLTDHKVELVDTFKLEKLPIIDNHTHYAHGEHDEYHTNDVRAGYRWHCKSCNFTSAWHLFFNTAAKRANSHTIRTGHATITYGV